MERGNEVCETEMVDPDFGVRLAQHNLLLRQIETFKCGPNYNQPGER